MTQQTKRNQKLLQQLIKSLLVELDKEEDFFYMERPWILTRGIPQEVTVSPEHTCTKKNIHWLLNKITDILPKEKALPD